MSPTRSLPVRILAGHPRTIAALVVGLAAYPLLGLIVPALPQSTRVVLAWDIGSLLCLLLCAALFIGDGDDTSMGRNAMAQQEGEWTMFLVTLAAIAFSFVALGYELSGLKDMTPAARGLHVGLVAATLLLSWLVTHVLFALRYAHEFYTATPDPKTPDSATPTTPPTIDGGLDFPGDHTPDYWDFVYFSLVLGMTFQVSDVQITSRKFRRLATVHGLIGFLFNTVIIALTVNIAAGLM